MEHKRTFIVKGEQGLHARPAAELAKAAGAFSADIVVTGNGVRGDGKSILSILELGIGQGEKLTVTANGADAAEAVQAITQTLHPSAADLEPGGDYENPSFIS